MTRRPGWWGPDIGGDEQDVKSMLDGLVYAHGTSITDDVTRVDELISALAELGVWTVGTPEHSGGGGAELGVTALVFERLGRAWPALGWASAQAHAAVDVLGGRGEFDDLVTRLHAGIGRIAVVDDASDHVRLARTGAAVAGTVDRVDAAGETPDLLILVGDEDTLYVPATGTAPKPLQRMGLGGAFTRALDVDTTDAVLLSDVDGAAVRQRLRLGAAAVASGIAGSAADAAAEYARERNQFGGPLTALATVRGSLLTQASRAVAGFAPVYTATGSVQTHAALTAACDGAVDAAAAALQSHGGYGYLTEYDAERRLRDALSLRAAVDTAGSAVATAAALVGVDLHASALGKEQG